MQEWEAFGQHMDRGFKHTWESGVREGKERKGKPGRQNDGSPPWVNLTQPSGYFPNPVRCKYNYLLFPGTQPRVVATLIETWTILRGIYRWIYSSTLVLLPPHLTTLYIWFSVALVLWMCHTCIDFVGHINFIILMCCLVTNQWKIYCPLICATCRNILTVITLHVINNKKTVEPWGSILSYERLKL
jgi:hypothetical protein